jgi:hypothetical protein
MLNKEEKKNMMQTWLYKEQEGKKYERRMKGHEVSHDKEMKDKVYLSK